MKLTKAGIADHGRKYGLARRLASLPASLRPLDLFDLVQAGLRSLSPFVRLMVVELAKRGRTGIGLLSNSAVVLGVVPARLHPIAGAETVRPRDWTVGTAPWGLRDRADTFVVEPRPLARAPHARPNADTSSNTRLKCPAVYYRIPWLSFAFSPARQDAFLKHTVLPRAAAPSCRGWNALPANEPSFCRVDALSRARRARLDAAGTLSCARGTLVARELLKPTRFDVTTARRHVVDLPNRHHHDGTSFWS